MLEKWLLRLSLWSIARPWRALAAAALITLAAAPGLLKLELRTDGHALVPPDHPAVHIDAQVRERFNLRDPIIILIETSHPDGIFNSETIRKVQQLSQDLQGIQCVGPGNIMSLATEKRDRVFPNTLRFRGFLDPMPDTPLLMSLLKSDVRAVGILHGTLVSKDEKAVSIMVGTPALSEAEPDVYARREQLYRDIVEAVRPYRSGQDRILVVGAPVAESLLGMHIIEDLALLVPLSMALIALILWLGCRRWRGVLIGLIEVAACLTWTFGLMGWLGFPVYLTTALLPVILTTMGLADEVHIFWHYQKKLELGEEVGPHPAAVRQAFRGMVRPVLLTSVTTSLGLLSFLASSIAPIRSFGLFAALGILFCLFWSLTGVAAMLALAPPDKMRRPHPQPGRASQGGRLAHLAGGLIRRRAVTIPALLLLTVGLGLGVGRLYVQDSWIEGFAPSSEFRQATDRVNLHLFGTHTLLVQLTFDPPQESIPKVGSHKGPLLDPEALQAVGDIEAFLRRQPQTGGVLGLHSHLRSVAYLWRGRQEGGHEIPSTPNGVDRVYRIFDRGRGKHRRLEVVDEELRRCIVSIYLKNANYQETEALMQAVREYEAQHLAPRGISLEFAGDVAVSQAMIPAIVESQILSLLLALAGAFAAVCLLYRSLRTGLYAILPASTAVLWTFGAMGWLDVPLGVATSMFCAITLGIGVDYAIHFLERYREARDQGHPTPAQHALQDSGPAIAIDAAAVSLGLGLLMFSQVPANASLGLLVAFALISGCLLTLVGLGSLLSAKR
ncbi:MAG: MMPL family transporter [Acidobacteriota bacterium]